MILDNNEEYEAEVVGIDEKTDVAVIKIDASNLTAAEFGNSDELVVGERIVAIGNPTGMNLAGSVTQGHRFRLKAADLRDQRGDQRNH